MEDEPWVIEDPSESVPEEVPVVEAAPEAAEAKEPEPEPEPVKEAPKKLIFKHWVRPKFLQYNYLYDYRRNYYDDVIAYLDKRQSAGGSVVETPRPQTWGERALRSYISRPNGSLVQRAARQDTCLLAHISAGARFHRYHSKSLISRKYSSLGITTVNVIV